MPSALALVAALGALLVAQASPQPPTPAPAATPGPTTTPGPTAVPTSVATTPVATPTPLYKFVYRPTPAATSPGSLGPGGPEIDEIDLNDTSVVPPAPLHVRVLTSAAVISVAAETFGRAVTIPQKATGEFTFDGYVPQVPFFLRNRTFNIQFVATVSDGRSASITLPLSLR